MWFNIEFFELLPIRKVPYFQTFSLVFKCPVTLMDQKSVEEHCLTNFVWRLLSFAVTKVLPLIKKHFIAPLVLRSQSLLKWKLIPHSVTIWKFGTMSIKHSYTKFYTCFSEKAKNTIQ